MPDAWCFSINNTIRTTFAVKYLNVVVFLAREVEQKLNDLGMDTKVNYEDKAEGYYAIHLYLSVDMVVQDGQMSSVVESCSVEL